MNVNHFAFYMPRNQAVLQQTQMRDGRYFLRGGGAGLGNFQKNIVHGGKIEQVLPTYYPGPVCYFKRYSCMHELLPSKENHSQHKGEKNISRPQKLPNNPLPHSLKNIIVCP